MRKTFKSVYRNFTRKPVINLINLAGLSISLALVIILSVYCFSEMTTDNFHVNGKRVFLFSDSNNLPGIYSPGILKEQIDLNIPEVETTVRMAGPWEAPVFQAAGKEPITSDLLFADKDFFRLFTYRNTEGNLATALQEPMTVVITKKLSEKLFGKEPAMGKTLKMNNDRVLTVKSVIEEPEGNSALSFSAITSMDTRQVIMPNPDELKAWDMCLFQTFVLLKNDASPVETAKRISSLFPKGTLTKESSAKLTLFKKLYFTNFSLFINNYLHSGDQKKVMILLMVAALVLIVALVNFVNIYSSQWIDKIRQTGILKIIGAGRSEIFINVLSEAFLIFLISLLIAFLAVPLIVPSICNYTGITFNQQQIFTPSFLSIALGGIIVLTIILSIVPAFRISASKATDDLKNATEPGTTGSDLRGVLITAQFTIAIVLIGFTILVQKQVRFGSNNPGFKNENIIGIKLTQDLFQKKEVLENQLSEIPTVAKISFTQYYPGETISHWGTQLDLNGEKRQIEYDSFNADAGFAETMGLELKRGRYYSGDGSADANKVLVNETFVQENKLTDPIGGKFQGISGTVYEITGVVKDFHYKPFTSPIGPLVIMNEPYASYCLATLNTTGFNTIEMSLQKIKTAVTALSPSFPVNISFFDEAVENMYLSELQFRRSFSLFTVCALVICCLGILALSLFACQRRIKEIGIRRVNGARISEVVILISSDLIKWVAIAILIATPVSWYFMNKWLGSFAYKTGLSWWIFVTAGLMALVTALLTISFQTYRSAAKNPVESLRYE